MYIEDPRTVEYNAYAEAHITTVRSTLANAPGLEEQIVTEEELFVQAQIAARNYKTT